METCYDCTLVYNSVYNLPDEIWKEISPKPWEGFGGGGLLCLQCADERARAKDIHLYWSAKEGEFPDAK